MKWSMEADYLQACSCEYGCPCEFEAPPSQGFCEGLIILRVTKGRYGDVPLDGFTVGVAAHWPGPMHKGNGHGICAIDERASPAQRDALWKIVSGQAGGMPFEIIRMVVPKMQPPVYVPANFTWSDRNSSAKLGDAIVAAVEPIKNPVTGDPEQIRVEHGTGLLFKSAEVVAGKECRAAGAGLNFSWPNKSAFVTKVKYAN
jgi:hypothetical protein